MLIYYPSTIFIRNKYFRWYRSIVERSSGQTEYAENHHILPKSIFPEFTAYEWNLSRLSYREHFLAHWLLSKCMVQTNHKQQMLFALGGMRRNRKGQKRVLSSWHYSILKTAAKQANEYQRLPEIREVAAKRTSDWWSVPENKERQSKAISEAANKPGAKDRRIDRAKECMNRPDVLAKKSSYLRELQSDPVWREENTFHCDCCNRYIVGKGNWKKHLKSKHHLDKCKG